MFHVYENWRAEHHKATVHLDSCGHCNYGHGARGGTRVDNGRWHGPFDSLMNAQAAVPGITPAIHRCVALPPNTAAVAARAAR